MPRNSTVILTALLCFLVSACQIENDGKQGNGPTFSVRFDAAITDTAQDGRLLLLLATHDDGEPRFLVDNSADTQLVFGLNVKDWQGGTDVVIDQAAIGFPLSNLTQVPPGTYYAQALLNRYKDFRLGNGKVVSLPPDRGEGQQWNR
jgi:hypothetical protein